VDDSIVATIEAKDLDLDAIPPEVESSWGKNFGFDYHYPLVSRSPEIKEIFTLIKKVAKSNATILIQGETGTGKELIAGLIQFISHRSDKPYVKVNCAALPENLLESELFGHEKGACTGADRQRIGRFELANEGTLFLDEIGDMPLTAQTRLLRVLQEREFTPVGGSSPIKADVRIIAATNRGLERMVEEGSFREDLYYRLQVFPVRLPPLRERREDIPLLALYFMERMAAHLNKAITHLTAEALATLKVYDWPGNVRELKNFVESILVLEKSARITREMVERKLGPPQPPRNENLPVLISQSPEQAERELILRQLLLLRQDVGLIRDIVTGQVPAPLDSRVSLFPNETTPPLPKHLQVDEHSQYSIRDEAIGDMNLADLEKEAIMRTLQHFNNNRRAAARSLGMSERTLYRKIKDYGLGRKIKSSK